MEKDLQDKGFLENLGYSKKLCILPFDHRSFFEELLEFKEPLTVDQRNQLIEYKKIIYLGYEKSLTQGILQGESAILVDDEFGLEILLDAKQKDYITLQSTEVSGDNHFEFAHGADWQSWIEKVKPTFVKALVRYNVDGDKKLNQLTLEGLKPLSDYAHDKGYKFLIEPLVPATEQQLTMMKNDKHRYDTELRPTLTARMITEMHQAGIEPDIWKIEGMFAVEDYEKVVSAAKEEGRTGVGVISLGRNETDAVVETWLKIGAMTPGVIGFAVGRTIFLDALMKFRSGTLTQDQAAEQIAERFVHFYQVFNGIKQ